MAKKTDTDKAVEDRIRAHIRQKMERRGLGVTAAARLLKMSQPNLTRILHGERGVSAGFALRVSEQLQIDLEHLYHVDPPQQFWGDHVPRPIPNPGVASPSSARTARPTAQGAGTAAGTYPPIKTHRQ